MELIEQVPLELPIAIINYLDCTYENMHAIDKSKLYDLMGVPESLIGTDQSNSHTNNRMCERFDKWLERWLGVRKNT